MFIIQSQFSYLIHYLTTTLKNKFTLVCLISLFSFRKQYKSGDKFNEAFTEERETRVLARFLDD